ncbi:MAG: thiamine phosphate synthase [Gammaproteobacteria bacterium]|nr:thiamine phosphate synthase [Gammaproteobacteria bacterium]
MASSNLKDKLRGLYAITDENLITEDHFSEVIEAALQGGASIIQYRDKSKDKQKRLQQASTLRKLCHQYQAICIINDDIELARAVNADGVHLGRDDAKLSHARQTLGDDAIIGISCYNDIELALNAERNSADYVAFGTMFSSSTKPEAVTARPEIISQAKQQLSIPVCAIGGITDKNIQQVILHHSDMAAVINSLFAASDIKSTANSLSQYFS